MNNSLEALNRCPTFRIVRFLAFQLRGFCVSKFRLRILLPLT